MKVEKSILVIVMFLLLSFNVAVLFAQPELNQARNYDVPNFYYDLINVASPDAALSRLQIYLKILYEELQFTLGENNYQAKYEVSAVILDEKGNQVDGKSADETVAAESYDQTNSRQDYSISYLKFDLFPGKYKISLSVTDLETQQTKIIKDEVRLQDFSSKELMTSDLSFVRNVVIDSLGVKSFHPDVSNCIKDLTSELFIYFEIYSKIQEDENYSISYSVKKVKGKQIVKDEYRRSKDGARTLEFFQLSSSKLSQGAYQIEISVTGKGSKAEINKIFFIRWANMPSSVTDINLAIQQLKYIANKKDIDKLNKVASDEKLDKFVEFWKDHDPTPGTQTNEWMDEYYRRIQYANENFSIFREGWKTDMGMIYIIFGPPSDVERHPFDSDSKPYEIWYYNNINKYFVFMDESGFGEYRLLTRSWESWRELIRDYE
ncbi:GWxTD domain-containing protein [candidate division KSB1 bacterium]|nr:GWxTD domain-containing protein [candidate division KSB1 bacterium]